jgi:phosphoribosylglycinamide formyltransferase-1
MKRLGILISGRGSNMEAIAGHIAAGSLDAEIAIVISNRPGARGLEIARQRGLPTVCIPSQGMDREAHDRLTFATLQNHQVDLVCLAGYMRLLSPWFIQQLPQRILNIHPSLLPAFPGLEAQRQAVEYGVKVTGCTVHFVDEHLDHGPIVAQTAIAVEDTDTPETLSARLLREEHRLYAEAIALVLSGRYRIEGRRVIRT